MRKPTVILDADGVVYDAVKCAMDRINRKYGTKYTEHDVRSYGITSDPLINEQLSFYKDPSFVYEQPLYKGAQEFVTKLQENCEVVFCTSVPPQCAEARFYRLKEDFGIGKNEVIIASRKELVAADFFVDDCPTNICGNRSKYPILFRRDWNCDLSGVMSVTNYNDTLAFVNFVMSPKPFAGIPRNGSIICLVGPTGSGKNAICDEMCSEGYKKLRTYSTSGNSRYLHLTRDEFNSKQDSGFFMEYSSYGGEFYGISRNSIEAISDVNNYILPMDICGAICLKNAFPDRVTIAFCDAGETDLITGILRKDCPEAEKVCRIRNIEAEKANKRFCDVSIRNVEELKKIIKEETK